MAERIKLNKISLRTQKQRLAMYQRFLPALVHGCLLYTSDPADDLTCVDLGGRRIIKKNKNKTTRGGAKQ